jgi:hypothetical protein
VAQATPRALDPRKITEDWQVGVCGFFKQLSRFEFILLSGRVHAHPSARIPKRRGRDAIPLRGTRPLGAVAEHFQEYKMSTSVIAIIVGAAFLGIALIRGGIRIGVKEGEASIPTLKPLARVLAFLIGAGFIVFGLWREVYSSEPILSIDAISGTWIGIAKSGDFEFDVRFEIGTGCKIGSVCGTFDFPAIGCSGKLTVIEMDDNLFRFQAHDRTGGCFTTSDIQDSLELLPNGTLLYTSKSSSYSEMHAVLSKSQ